VGVATAGDLPVAVAHLGDVPCVLERRIAFAAEISVLVIRSRDGKVIFYDVPRNTHDSELRALADKGGVAGIYFMPFLRDGGQPRPADLIRHIEHAVNVAGEDHVALGTDGAIEGDVLNAETAAAQRRFYEERKAQGIAAPGEAPDVFNLIPDYNEPRRFLLLADDLAARGWPARRIEKLLGGNFARLCADVWGDAKRG